MLYACKGAGVVSLSSLPLSLPFSLSLFSLTGEEVVCGRALCLQGCAHPLHQSERERERERERKDGERESERERERERKREKERERQMLNIPRIVIFIFKRNDTCLGTF
jgi:hypothetical protein